MAKVDPVTFSVLMHRFNSIASEMTLTLENAAMSSILGLCRDYSCCIYDAQERQVATVDALPIHTNSMHLILGEIRSKFEGEINEGDVFLCNDPYSGNSHVGDLVVACPVFLDSTQLFWAATKAHQLDVGAPLPISANAWATDVWQEGITIPPVKLVDRGVRNQDLIDMYLANVRWRESLEGDLMAMLGSVWTGSERLREVTTSYGQDLVVSFVDEVIDYAAKRTANEIKAMPDGTYEAIGWLDSDGEQHDIEIRCAVRIEGDQIEVDFSGSAPQVKAGINASYAVAQAAGGIPVVMAIDPDIPHNEGCLRSVKVIAEPGTICNAVFPAATSTATTEPADLMQDIVCKALAKAIPDRVRAGTAHWANIPMLSGEDDQGGSWGHLMLNDGGGGGAANGADGWPLIVTNAAHGGLKTASVEETELLYPVIFAEWEIEPESMGFGEFIGGPGVRCTIKAERGAINVLHKNDAHHNPPFGVNGGTAAKGGGHYLTRSDGRRLFLGTACNEQITTTDGWTGVSSGGGGFGHPFLRPVEDVLRDVRDGFYGVATAREHFGVSIYTGDDGRLQSDVAETERLRAGRDDISKHVGTSTPNTPGASTWLVEMVTPSDAVDPSLNVRLDGNQQ